MKFEYPPGATPIDPDAAAGLLLPIQTQVELDEAEALNIETAIFELTRTGAPRTFPTDVHLRDLHRRMFDHVWKWAGTYRISDTNISVPWTTITEQVRNCCADAQARVEADRDPDELCVWLHWRLAWIHTFPNGNGRHARLATDRLRQRLGLPAWTWGDASLNEDGDVRRRYIAGLRAADGGDLKPLLGFVQTEG